MALPGTRSGRWEHLQCFLGNWFGFNDSDPGVEETLIEMAESRLGLTVPVALRERHTVFGNRDRIWSPQDRLLPPQAWTIEEDTLVVVRENQNAVRWGIRLSDLESRDPPIVVSDHAGTSRRWLPQSKTTSEFACVFAALNVKWSGLRHPRCNGPIEDELIVSVIEETFPRLPFRDRNFPSPPTRLYGGDDIIIELHAGVWAWATARDEGTLDAFEAAICHNVLGRLDDC